ncbi:hypothetical protein [Novosphingobium huizhouense]|uniref:hypothetical protein n=1 Tax=Novosphingobium huizhouense TaxID=2866625 RepID=UPI001CD8F370|nr:hypothetical protein [Novosphingobium huizhouense]
MTLMIRTQRGTLGITMSTGHLPQPAQRIACANDTVLDEAAFHLREALACLDRAESLIAAAYVDQALSMLRVQRAARASEG